MSESDDSGGLSSKTIAGLLMYTTAIGAGNFALRGDTRDDPFTGKQGVQMQQEISHIEDTIHEMALVGPTAIAEGLKNVGHKLDAVIALLNHMNTQEERVRAQHEKQTKTLEAMKASVDQIQREHERSHK